jgi:hypothetical protein
VQITVHDAPQRLRGSGFELSRPVQAVRLNDPFEVGWPQHAFADLADGLLGLRN